MIEPFSSKTVKKHDIFKTSNEMSYYNVTPVCVLNPNLKFGMP